jgi:hypothetical protein
MDDPFVEIVVELMQDVHGKSFACLLRLALFDVAKVFWHLIGPVEFPGIFRPGQMIQVLGVASAAFLDSLRQIVLIDNLLVFGYNSSVHV